MKLKKIIQIINQFIMKTRFNILLSLHFKLIPPVIYLSCERYLSEILQFDAGIRPEAFNNHKGINSDLPLFIFCGYEYLESEIIFRLPVYLTYA
jgi:hypothetical protein